MEELQYIENLATPEYKENLQKVLNGNQFPWFYHLTTVDEKDDKTYQFVHTVLRDGVISQTEYLNFFTYLLKLLNDNFNIKVNSLLRVKANFLPSQNCTEEELERTWHKDIENLDDSLLYALVYYVNDSDGDTYFKTKNGIKSFTPKAGNAVLFKANLDHRATPPSGNHEKRIVINYVFTIDEPIEI